MKIKYNYYYYPCGYVDRKNFLCFFDGISTTGEFLSTEGYVFIVSNM